VIDRTVTLKIDQNKLNAEDNIDALLAEAEYCFNNADEILASCEEESLLAA